MQAITINSSNSVSVLETAIQGRLNLSFNNVPLRICQIYLRSVVERQINLQIPISAFFSEEVKSDCFNILVYYPLLQL
jgi:hypothetical protein